MNAAAPLNPTRKRALLAIAALVAVAAVAYGIYWYLYLSHYEDTDDAYVQGPVVLVTAQVAGTVLAVDAQDTDHVTKGQRLVALDPADAQAALDEARATLAQTQREVGQVYGNDAATVAGLQAREADVANAAADRQRADQDLARRRTLAARQVISREDLNHAQAVAVSARAGENAARAALEAGRQQLSANRELTNGVAPAAHPKVQAAEARVREAQLMLARATVNAPVSGVIAKRNVQLGQRVQPGVPMLAIVPLDQVWVDANFKEVQLRKMHVGQSVLMHADQFGKDVTFHGRVAGLGAGTGAAFALLPAQNATGNWIKVVQRVPVRIALQPDELRAHPLRIGLSMQVEVNTADGGDDTSTSAAGDAPRGDAGNAAH
ncbi:HlyD family efflux transporter periplasmic adaptor subunit [soil metagenome]